MTNNLAPRLTQNINFDRGRPGDGHVVVGGLADEQGVQVAPRDPLQHHGVHHPGLKSEICSGCHNTTAEVSNY